MNIFKKYQHIFATLGMVLLAFVVLGTTFGIGVYMGMTRRPAIDKVLSLTGKETPPALTTTDFSPFWKAWALINEKYPTTVSDQDKVWGAIAGLTASLGDPYTVFFNPEESKEFAEEIAGAFSGVGMEVGIKDKLLTVIAPMKNTPAYRAGIKAGDKILKIDNVVTSNLIIDEAIKKIRGEQGTSVHLTIYREGEKQPREIDIVRAIIEIPTLDTEKREDGIFVIRVYNFSATVSELFRKALIEFAESGSTKLVIDLRGNPGGYLDAAIDMASWFLPKDKIVVKEELGKEHEEKIHYSKGYDVFGKNLKVVILIDGGSASASEILAGALGQNGVATLVGQKSFGKGSVQEVIPLTKDTSMKITIAKWLTPNGTSISEHGIIPDVVVEIPKDADLKKDLILEKAIEILSK